MLKREARFGPDLAGKVRISFAPNYEAVGGAGGSEGREYTQIWERNTLVARRCLGKGRALDKLVLDAALWNVLCSEEEKAGVPMEVEEHEAGDGGEKEVFGDLFRIPCSNQYNSGGGLQKSEFTEFKEKKTYSYYEYKALKTFANFKSESMQPDKCY